MSTAIEQKLRKIAGVNHVNKALENLIANAHDYEKKIRDEMKAELEQKKEELEEKWSKKINNFYTLGLKKDNQKLEKTNEIQQEFIKKYLFRVCELEHILKRNDIQETILTTEEEAAVLGQRESKMKYHHESLSSKLALSGAS